MLLHDSYAWERYTSDRLQRIPQRRAYDGNDRTTKSAARMTFESSACRTRPLSALLAVAGAAGLCLVAAVQDLQATPAADPADEFVGPFPSWADAKRDYGAVGDGQNDDTAALQKALDELRREDRQQFVLYVPAGTYRITRTLVLLRQHHNEAKDNHSIGEETTKTMLLWD